MLLVSKAGDRPRTQVLQLEKSADLAARAVGDHHRVWRGEPLHPRSEVRGFADRSLLSRIAFADRRSNYHEASRDPDADAQALAMDRALADRGDHGEPSA